MELVSKCLRSFSLGVSRQEELRSHITFPQDLMDLLDMAEGPLWVILPSLQVAEVMRISYWRG